MTPTTNHISKSFDTELARLAGEIVHMGELAVSQLLASIDMVEHHDGRAAARIVENDDVIDAMEHEIGHAVVRLLALRAPLARDLREVFAALRIATDIERIGDHAASIAKRAESLSSMAPVGPATGLRQLSQLAIEALRQVLLAYQNGDANAAHAVWVNDVKLDEAYTGLFRELLTYMMEDSRSITACTHLLFIAKNIERIGDHATNIAENVWFLVKGKPLQTPRQKCDRTSNPEFD